MRCASYHIACKSTYDVPWWVERHDDKGRQSISRHANTDRSRGLPYELCEMTGLHRKNTGLIVVHRFFGVPHANGTVHVKLDRLLGKCVNLCKILTVRSATVL